MGVRDEVGRPLQIKLLGPVLVLLDDARLPVRAPQLQGVVGILATRSNTAVSRAELLDALWGDQPPASAENALHVYVARLRRHLEPDRAHRAPGRFLVSTGAGYLLRLEPDQLDVRLVEAHRDRAHRLRATGDLDGAARSFDAALALWRGIAWSGVPGPFAQAERNRLDELWLMLFEERAETMLALGRHRDLVAELRKQAAAHPLREHLRALLMQVLYQSGRQAEALRVFRATRRALIDGLGIEPGLELQQLHQRILAADSTLIPTRTAPVPRQLPADVANFTGREHHLAALHAVLDRRKETGSPPVMICAIDGTAGAGKTTLAVHFGHSVADRFPDGQLYVDLRGYAPGKPMSTSEALARLLRGLGLPPEQIPADEDEQAATYRSVLAAKRMLVLLDNARGARQARPLLPGGPGCLVVITSRTTLASIDGATHLHLDMLPEHDALALLAQLVGPDRTRAEPQSAATLVALCCRLPLAIRIAGARLAARPTWPIHTLVERLTDERRRLDELQVSDRAVRASFEVSYHALNVSDDPTDRAAARTFRLLGVLDWVEMSVPVAAALLDLPQPDAQAALERLVDDHLLDSPACGRYRSHDLLRLYARDLAVHHEDSSARLAALLRALNCYLATAEAATRLVDPTAARRIEVHPIRNRQAGFVLHTVADVIAWIDAEHANLLVAAHQAVAAPDPAPATAVRLTDALFRPFRMRGHWQDLIALCELAARTAHRLGDGPGEAIAREDLARAYGLVGRTQEKIASGRRALAMWRGFGDRNGEQTCLRILGHAYRAQQRLGEAVNCLELALAINRDIGDRYGEGATLDCLGLVLQHLHRPDDAIACHRQAMAIGRDIGNGRLVAAALANLGWAYHRAEHSDQAITSYEQSLPMARALGARYLEAEILWGLGLTYHTLGRCDRARTYWLHSIAILRDIGELTDEEADTLRQQPVPDTPAIIQRNT